MVAPKFDLKKEFPQFYSASAKNIEQIAVPEMNFFMIDGRGDPNKSEDFKNAIECLYAVSYALKMKVVKHQDLSKDYVVPPLEGLWFMDQMDKWTMENKNEWDWTIMIRIPDFVPPEQIALAIKLTKEGKNPEFLPKLRVERYHEGEAIQLMHLGPYDDEPPNIARLHDYASKKGFHLHGKHHEIYLSDPRKADPGKMKTILRQPIQGLN